MNDLLSQGPPRSRRAVWVLALVVALSGAVNGYAFWGSTDSSNPAYAIADLLQQGGTPTVQATGPTTVEADFARAYTLGGRDITAYQVKRYDSPSSSPESASFTCIWPPASSLDCSETPVPDGTWYYTITTHVAGSLWYGAESGRSSGVTIDTTPPAPPSTPDLAAASDSGISDADNITNVTTPTFNGTAEANSTVRIYAGAAEVGSGPATGGNYSIAVSTLSEGTHNITATATDAFGNISDPSGTLVVTIDTTPPAPPSTPDLAAASDSGISDADNITNVTTPTFNGTAEANSTVRIYAGAAEVGSGPATGGNYSIQVSTLSEGTHNITATATDIAGNTSGASPGLTVTVDLTAPVVTETVIAKQTGFLAGAIKQSASYYIYANVSDAGGIDTVTADVSSITTGATSVVLTAGSYSAEGLVYNYRSAVQAATSGLTGGNTVKSYSITPTDLAGNSQTQSSFNVNIDNTAPAASDVQTANGPGTAGRADEGDTVTFTFSETIDPHSILSGWDGSATNVVFRLIDGGCTLILVCYEDSFRIRNAANDAHLPFGTVNLGRADYIGGLNLAGSQEDIFFGASGNPSVMTQSSGATITITLGTPSRTANTAGGNGTMNWVPSTSPYDRAGNNMSSSSVNETGSNDREF